MALLIGEPKAQAIICTTATNEISFLTEKPSSLSQRHIVALAWSVYKGLVAFLGLSLGLKLTRHAFHSYV